ncbi:J domain-containing protein [Salinilacihabitans rarus]|uniref:J domain-containing protein n=1 Tax=Salinilacihabitans rarus TaxID=2961596 RepID=UPI0020C89906|nr:J domain-containing protein [Salinilacihabitans rarus]
MPADLLEAIPTAVLAGLAIGAGFALVATALFVAGERLYPSRRSAPTGDSSEGRRRTEIRAYLREIDERFVEDHPIAGTTVAFYLPERDVAVTYDAHDFFRIGSATETYVVLCEHEMPGRHLGARLPFEVPDAESEPADSHVHEAVLAAYEALGVPITATRAEVRSAYRERVKEVHPDRGGDEESFRRVREAYATASEHAN